MAHSKKNTDVEISLSGIDLVPLQTIYNDAAGKGKHLRGRWSKDVRKVYKKALEISPEAVQTYIAGRETPAVARDVSTAISEDAPVKKAKLSREYGGSQPKQQEEARLYLKKLFDTGQLDELWSIWRQLCTNEQRSITRWKTPCPQDAEEVYFDAKTMAN
eukprot:COSAG03_NODE_4342_length_1584_cov_1.698520_4_plen_159_part_01